MARARLTTAIRVHVAEEGRYRRNPLQRFLHRLALALLEASSFIEALSREHRR